MPTYRNDTTSKIYYSGGLRWIEPGNEKEVSQEILTDPGLTQTSEKPYLSNPKTTTTTAVSASDYTDWVRYSSGQYVDLSIDGTFDGTISLMRKFTEDGAEKEVDTFTDEDESYFYVASAAYYRLGFSAYTSGEADLTMKRR